MGAPHRIRRLRLSLPARSTAEAFAARSQLHAEGLAAIEAALERAFDELVPGDDVLHVARLELRVTLEDGAQPGELAERAYLAARRELGDLNLEGRREEPTGARRIAGVEARREAVRVYLQTGTLAWEHEGRSASELAAWLNEALASTELGEPAASASVPERVAFYFRALQLLDERAWRELARRGGKAREPELEAALEALASGALLLTRYQRIVLAAVSLVACEASTDGAVRSELRSLVAAALAGSRTTTERSSDPMPAHPHELAATLHERGAPRAVVSLFDAALPAQTAPASGQAQGDRASASRQALSGGPAPKPPAVPAMKVARTAASEPLGLGVAHAGLVLLHPFLPRFFSAVGLLGHDERSLRAPELPRAAALAHFLATGEEEALEHDLGLVKLLLGLAPEAPLPIAAGLLTPSDREEAEALLRAVVDHWHVLKSTSLSGLRSAFLARRGLVSAVDGGQRLRVEASPFDVLLAQLPWGIGIVRLPWMTQAIFTEWVTP